MTLKNTRRYIITHPKMGVYLGNSSGLGFWSKLDILNLTAAVTFPSVASAIIHVASWIDGNNPRDYNYKSVYPDLPGHYVSLTKLIKDGFIAEVGDLVLKEQIPPSQLRH